MNDKYKNINNLTQKKRKNTKKNEKVKKVKNPKKSVKVKVDGKRSSNGNSLTYQDNIKLLKYYYPRSKKVYTKKKLEKKINSLLIKKFCGCIKSMASKNNENNDENKYIRICTNSIFTRKNIKRGNFKCRNKPFLVLRHV